MCLQEPLELCQRSLTLIDKRKLHPNSAVGLMGNEW